MNIDANILENFCASLLKAGGYTEDESRIAAASLVLSDLMGYDSHGAIRVGEYLHALKKGKMASNVGLDIERETPGNLLADANCGLGQVQMPKFLSLLLDRAVNCASVTGALRRCGHVGRLGEWSETIARAGYAGIVAVNDNGTFRVVAPPGGKDRCTSTNPMAFCIPLPGGEIFSLDFSTSAAAMGKMRIHHLSGMPCPPGLIQDANGNPSTNPGILFDAPPGALLPMGGAQGYKGFGLSMIVDCLTAGLSGGFTPPGPDDESETNNVFVSIWNPAFFAGLDHMGREAQKYIDFVRNSTPVDAATPIRIPGDRARAEMAKRLKTGIPLSEGTRKTLLRSAEITRVTPPEAFQV